jgi:hypothetical protein
MIRNNRTSGYDNNNSDLVSAVLFASMRLLPPQSQRLFYKVFSLIVATAFVVYFALFLFVPVDRNVSIDNRPIPTAKVYTRLFGHSMLIVEPGALDGSMYLYFPGTDIDQMKTGEVAKVSVGIFRLFGGLSYFTPFPDVNSLAALDGGEDLNSMLVESHGRQISFQDDSGRIVIIR